MIVSLGCVHGTICEVVDGLREEGTRVGAVTLTSFRPFPLAALAAALAGARRVVVLEKSLAVGLGGVLASLHDGITRATEPGPPHTGDAYQHSDAAVLPRTLGEAADAFARSAFTHAALGKDVVTHYQSVATFEWTQFLSAVTDWERVRYLEPI